MKPEQKKGNKCKVIRNLKCGITIQLWRHEWTNFQNRQISDEFVNIEVYVDPYQWKTKMVKLTY